MTAVQALRTAAVQLASSNTPRLDAELLLAHALGIARNDLLLRLPDLEVPPSYAAFVARRAAGEPLAYITGVRDFWTLTLAVTPDVLIPRPDSETLIEAAIGHFAGTPGPATILDLGTGSGALLLAALAHWPHATGLGIDSSTAAVTVAQGNADHLGFASRARFQTGNWSQGFTERFDLILCNPPYIAAGYPLARDVADHEPHAALFAGADGLDDYRILAPQIAGLLARGGAAAVEIGFDQATSAGALFAAAGLDVSVRRDLGGNDRCLLLTP